MDSVAWFKAYIEGRQPSGPWSAEADCAVREAIRLYRRNGDDDMKQYVLAWANHLMQAEGCCPASGKALFFALETTGDLRFRQAIEGTMAQLGRNPSGKPLEAAALYAELPFRMAYEMQLGGMEKVGLVAAAFRQAHVRHWNAKRGLFGGSQRATAQYLLALTDAIDTCSDQLYEHWRALVDLFRDSLRGALAAEVAAPETEGMLLTALLDGVRMGLIDPERYLPIAEKRIAALEAAGHENLAAMLVAERGVL